MLILAGACVLAIWVYLVAGHGHFWREFSRGSAAAQSETRADALSVIAVIPARNEAEHVGRAVASLAEQRYGGRFHIMLVDDDSSDETAEAARAAASPAVLTVVRARALAAGWSGKLWAIAEGMRQAPFQPDVFLLTDADIVHPTDNLKRLCGQLENGYDLASFMVTLANRSFAERALIPAFVWFFFLLYPPAWVRSRKHHTAGAAGGCILVRREALERIGGIEAIRGELIDDCALAAAVKSQGGRVWLGLSAETQSIRPYATFGEIGRMISRTAFTQLRHSVLLLLGTTLGLLLAFVAPVLLTLIASQPAAGMGACAWLLMSIAYFPALRFYGTPWYQAPLLPVVAVFYLSCTMHSAVSYWRGTGGVWKGRVQDRK